MDGFDRLYVAAAVLFVAVPLLWRFRPMCTTKDLRDAAPALCEFMAEKPIVTARQQCEMNCGKDAHAFESKWYGDSCTCGSLAPSSRAE